MPERIPRLEERIENLKEGQARLEHLIIGEANRLAVGLSKEREERLHQHEQNVAAINRLFRSKAFQNGEIAMGKSFVQWIFGAVGAVLGALATWFLHMFIGLGKH